MVALSGTTESFTMVPGASPASRSTETSASERVMAAYWPALPAWPSSPLRLFVTAMTVLPVVFLLSPREVGGEVAERQRSLRGCLRAPAWAGGRAVRARDGSGHWRGP